MVDVSDMKDGTYMKHPLTEEDNDDEMCRNKLEIWVPVDKVHVSRNFMYTTSFFNPFAFATDGWYAKNTARRVNPELHQTIILMPGIFKFIRYENENLLGRRRHITTLQLLRDAPGVAEALAPSEVERNTFQPPEDVASDPEDDADGDDWESDNDSNAGDSDNESNDEETDSGTPKTVDSVTPNPEVSLDYIIDFWLDGSARTSFTASAENVFRQRLLDAAGRLPAGHAAMYDYGMEKSNDPDGYLRGLHMSFIVSVRVSSNVMTWIRNESLQLLTAVTGHKIHHAFVYQYDYRSKITYMNQNVLDKAIVSVRH